MKFPEADLRIPFWELNKLLECLCFVLQQEKNKDTEQEVAKKQWIHLQIHYRQGFFQRICSDITNVHGPEKSGNAQGKAQQECPLVTLKEMITLLRWLSVFYSC